MFYKVDGFIENPCGPFLIGADWEWFGAVHQRRAEDSGPDEDG